MVTVLYWLLMIGALGFLVWFARFLVVNDKAAKTNRKPPGDRS